MTIISAIIKRDFIIVASDSLIVEDNKRKFPKNPKFVAFPKLRCIVSYWGRVSIKKGGKTNADWEIGKWLHEKLNHQDNFTSIEEFGVLLTKELTCIFQNPQYSWPEYKMLGIHLLGFECFENKWIPELFLIIGDSNGWNFNFSRRTYGDLKNWENMETDIILQRETVYNVLEKGYTVYNNGDNEMFNHFYNSFHEAIKSTANRAMLLDGFSKEFFHDLATFPIKQVAYFQKKYYGKENISVGGKVHSILMNSNGTIEKKNFLKINFFPPLPQGFSLVGNMTGRQRAISNVA